LSDSSLLQVQHLSHSFPEKRGLLKRAVNSPPVLQDINLVISPQEIVGLVGESGCGKSTLARLLLRIYEPTKGQIQFAGEDIYKYKSHEYYGRVQMIFQDPFSSLNPKLKIGFLLREMWNLHQSESVTTSKLNKLLDEVGLSANALNKYPHEFSGGQRQRIAIARALAASPDMLVADEPVSALDVSIQAQILNLLQQLRKERNLTLLFISHDLAVVEQLCDRILVLYRGRLMEELQKQQLDQARHPYTKLLLDSLPSYAKRETGLPIAPVEAEDVPIKGCPFVNRCSEAQAVCSQRMPQWSSLSQGHRAACHALKSS
jgi:oligopeptide/dipeptide ABC transporter ATP-binding protein